MNNKAVEIRNLSYVYPDGRKALRNISLDIFSGESIGIIGPNGAGKTTLLLHLNGLLKGTGLIRVLGLEVKAENLTQIRSKIGIVFQDPENQLFMPTVGDDVAFGPLNMDWPKQKVESSVKEALEDVGMLTAISRPPHHLSLGEKKRVSIATVLSMQSEILVLDEPTSNLDPRGRRDIIRLLQGINKTKIIASHDLEMITQLCSRYAFLDKGMIVKYGSIQDGLPALYKHGQAGLPNLFS